MTWKQIIENHYLKIWGISGKDCNFSAGPIHQLPNDFAVIVYPPHRGRTMWTYATRCMSQIDDKVPLELHMFSANASNDIVELLVVTAHFHRTSKTLGLWHTVNFGRPWLDKSLCDHGLISLPYLDGPEIETLEVSKDKLLKFYWLIPITKLEVEFKKRMGIEALEKAFERNGINYLDPGRKSAIAQKGSIGEA